MARHSKFINHNQFEKLCEIQCTLEDIAQWFQCSSDTIERWCKRQYKHDFADCVKRFSTGGKISLRRRMFKASEKSITMQIWLSKQHLGMRDFMYEDKDEGEQKDQQITINYTVLPTGEKAA